MEKSKTMPIKIPANKSTKPKTKFTPKKHHWAIIASIIILLSVSLIIFSPLKSFLPVRIQSPVVLVTSQKVEKNNDFKKILEERQLKNFLEILQSVVASIGLIGGAIITWRKVLTNKPENK